MMTNRFILVFVLLIGVVGYSAENSSPVAKGIEQALTNSLDQIKAGKTGQGIAGLLDVLMVTRPESSWPKGFAQNIKVAKELFLKGEIIGGVEKVSIAKQILKPAQETPSDKKESKVVKLGEIFQNNINQVKVHFQKGEADEGVILLLSTVEILAPKK